MKLKIKHFTVLEGPLYEINGEDGPYHVFDSEIVAITEDGKRFGRGYIVKGYGVSNERDYAYIYPNKNYKEECLDLVLKLTKLCSEVDLNLGWYIIPEPPRLEDLLAEEARIEEAERQGRYDRYNIETGGGYYWHEATYMIPT